LPQQHKQRQTAHCTRWLPRRLAMRNRQTPTAHGFRRGRQKLNNDFNEINTVNERLNCVAAIRQSQLSPVKTSL
jgi:hypothetical protein